MSEIVFDLRALAEWQRRVTPILVRRIQPDGRIKQLQAPIGMHAAELATIAAMPETTVDDPYGAKFRASPAFAREAVERLLASFTSHPRNVNAYRNALTEELADLPACWGWTAVIEHRMTMELFIRPQLAIAAAVLELRRSRKTLPAIADVVEAVGAEAMFGPRKSNPIDTGWRRDVERGRAVRHFPSIMCVQQLIWDEQGMIEKPEDIVEHAENGGAS